MPDERSTLLQNGREHDGEINYSAVNEPDPSHRSIDDEQQQTVVAPENSVTTLVRFGNFRDFILLLHLDR